jgi:bacterioferritin-associated ferredoxin
MAPVYIFAEQVRSIARSGKKEIEIPEGARISSEAADLIKEHQIQIKTVAPGRQASGKSSAPGSKSTGTASKSGSQKQAGLSAKKSEPNQQPEKTVDISEEELEEIINRIVKRFKQLKGGKPEKEESKKTDTAVNPQDESTASDDLDDLVICRCEEITLGEIRDAIRNGFRTLNGIKRDTRAGMGLCQGQTCQRLVTRIITEELGIAAADIDPTTARGPVRPLRLEVFANS